MEVGQSEFFDGNLEIRDILDSIWTCCVTPGNVAVLSPRVPFKCQFRTTLTFFTFIEQGGALPVSLSRASDLTAFSLIYSAYWLATLSSCSVSSPWHAQPMLIWVWAFEDGCYITSWMLIDEKIQPPFLPIAHELFKPQGHIGPHKGRWSFFP